MGDVIPFVRREHPVVEHLKRIGLPITRERVIDFNWPDGKPEPWEADHEADLPEELLAGVLRKHRVGDLTRPER
jgi:hypothetical protein